MKWSQKINHYHLFPFSVVMSISFLLSEQVLVIAGLLLVHVIYGSYSVFVGGILDDGISPIFVVVAGTLSTVFFLAPFAVAFERSKWPEKIRLGLLVKFLLASFGAVTLYQPLLLFGLEKTTPAISSALANLNPVFIFLIAACLQLEKFNIKCKYTIGKMVGTFMCIFGVLMVSMLQTSPASSQEKTNLDWIFGCLASSVAVFMLSCAQILMAVIMKEFHAPISLCAIIFFFGAITTAIIQIIVQGKLEVASSSSSISITMLIVYLVIIGAASGVCVPYQLWSIKTQGPVLVSMFNPITTIVAAILSALILRKFISFGSFVGIAIMFVGLYLFLWSKNKEISSIESVDGGGCGIKIVVEIEKPLLK